MPNTDSFVYFSKMYQAVPQLMELRKHTDGVFISNRQSTLDAVKKNYPDANLAKYRSWFKSYSPGFRALKSAAAILTGSPNAAILSEFSGTKCMVFHGTYMLMTKDVLRQMDHFDLLAMIGPRMRKTINRYRDELKLKNVVEAGYLPFGSYPVKSGALTIQTLEQFGLSPEKKTIVYMPWGKPYGSWNLLAEKIILESPQEFNLILRPHPSQALTPRREDLFSFKKISALCAMRPDTLLDINCCQFHQLFSIADLIISDGSSPAEESLFYDVPQLFIESPLWCSDVIYAKSGRDHVPIDEIAEYLDLFNCGVIFDTRKTTSLRQSIYNAINSANEYKSKRESYFKWVFGSADRHAASRVNQFVHELIGTTKFNSQ